jgi:hypothetical protein
VLLLENARGVYPHLQILLPSRPGALGELQDLRAVVARHPDCFPLVAAESDNIERINEMRTSYADVGVHLSPFLWPDWEW